MPTFRENPIEAFQIGDNEAMVEKRGWPTWLKEAEAKEPSETGSFHRTGGGFLLVHNPVLGYIPVNEGDWILQELDGTFSKLIDEEFQKRYEKVTAKKKASSKTSKEEKKEKEEKEEKQEGA